MAQPSAPSTPRWIGEPVPADWTDRTVYPPVVLRRRFRVPNLSRSSQPEAIAAVDAQLEISALGLYEAKIDGRRVGDHQLAPEWTDYSTRVQVQSYDVGELLFPSPADQDAVIIRRPPVGSDDRSAAAGAEHVIEVTLADGWYSGRIGLSAQVHAPKHRGIYGPRPRLWARLTIGGEMVVITDETWEYSPDGPVRRACLLDGEWRDFRTQQVDGFSPVVVDETIETELVSQTNRPIRITEELPARSVTPLPPSADESADDGTSGSRYIVDFGQNLAGWIRIRLHGRSGDDVRIRHGEMLDSAGELYRDNLRMTGEFAVGAEQEDHAILSGRGEGDLFEPAFTYHGFRYVELAGLREAPPPADIVACAVHSDSPATLEFECSNPMINALMKAIDWTLRDNLHSTPTDCPQRDERLGWMGDAQVFAQTACYLRDMQGFYEKWMRDIVDAQTDDGRFPDYAPHPYEPERHFSANPGWADAGIVIPYRVWRNYGDTTIIEEHFEAMYRWISFVRSTNPNGLFENLAPSDIHYGDWLNADTFALERFPKGRAAAPIEVFATALYARSIAMLAEMAAAIGRSETAEELRNLHTEVVAAFQQAYVGPDGRVRGNTQSCYAFALAYDLLPEELRDAAVSYLLEGIDEFDGHLSTGFLSTVEALKLLSATGHNDRAYRLVTSESFPSWGYMLANGATTIWERWDGYMPDRKPDVFQDPGMNSFCHYSIGAVGEWIVRTIGGLRVDNSEPAAAGFKRFIVAPQPGPGVEWAKLSYRSPQGLIQIDWRRDGDDFSVTGVVPEGAEAHLVLPDGRKRRVTAGRFSA